MTGLNNNPVTYHRDLLSELSDNEFVRKNVDYNNNFMNVVEGQSSKIKIKNKEPLKNELEAFAKCILNNEKSPVPGKDGVDALHIAQKFIESSKKNEVVVL